MKKFYIALIFALGSITITAQNLDTKKADKLFKRYEFVSAAEEYLKLVGKGKTDVYIYKQLADTYYNMFNTVEAEKWYAKVTETKQEAETYYRYAQMLKANGKYEEANIQMQKFASAAANDMRAKAFIKDPNYIPKLLNKSNEYELRPLVINSDKSDFGAVLHDNFVYFTSARNTIDGKKYGWIGEPFLDIYKASFNVDSTITNAVAVPELNSKYNDGPATISKDGNTIYFSSDGFREKSFEKDNSYRLKLSKNCLYRATKEGDKWANIILLPFNSQEYSTSNPSLSRDGKTLYFSSNRPGGIGGIDIWKVAVNVGESFGTPENLGAKVNTEGNESFPFIADDGKTLFFASSGRPGLGGLDVFKIDLSSDTEAVNLGKPINTEKDDFAFTFDAARKIGFLSSNRGGNDDIFAVIPICGVEIIVRVTDAQTHIILVNAKVAIVDDKQNLIATAMSDDGGEVKYRVECNKTYTIQASKEGYESNSFVVAKTREPQVKVDVPLEPIKPIKPTATEIVLNPIYFDFDKSNITQRAAFELDKLVQIMIDNPNLIILAKSHTDNRGSDKYNMSLSDRRAKSTAQYVISKGIAANRISGRGYGESQPKVFCNDNCTEKEHALNRRSEFLIIR